MILSRVSWVTPSNFVDVDLPIIEELQHSIDIYWQVVFEGKVSEDMHHYIEPKLSKATLSRLEYIEIPYRFFDLRTMHAYCNVLKNAKAFNPDLYYTSLQAAPFGPLIYRMYLPLKKTVAACHNVSTPKGANQETYARIFTYLHLQMFRNIQVFSESQREILYKKFPEKNVLMAPLAIKDYGEPNIGVKSFDEKKVTFLFFGMIMGYKRLDLLIDAAQNLYEQGYKNFKVKIAGKCKNWPIYAEKIRIPDLFDIRIEHIPNDDVADLFATSDYFVMPYQDIAQSGAITVAYRYNLPIIMSDLPQFKPFGIDGQTGLFFESKNANDLEEKMKVVLDGGANLNNRLKKGLADFVEQRYSTKSIAKKYLHFFEELLLATN